MTHRADKYAEFLGGQQTAGRWTSPSPQPSTESQAQLHRSEGGSQPVVVLRLAVDDPVIDMAVNVVGVIFTNRNLLILRRDIVDVDRGHFEQNARRRIPSQERVRGDNADAVDGESEILALIDRVGGGAVRQR